MRQETDKIVTAFIEGRHAHAARTMTDGHAMFLHGNMIAFKQHGKFFGTMAGWPTVTTRERLNGLCRKLGCGTFHQTNFKQFYGEDEIGPHDVIELKRRIP